MALLTATTPGLASDSTAWRDRKDVVDAFYKLPLRQRIDAFPTYGFEDEYAIYLYGSQAREPPAIYLAKPFAAQGGKVVAPLSLRLGETKNDSTIRDVVLVFSEMNRQHSYNIADDAKLMQLLRSAVSRMKNPGWKQISEKELASIQP
jgi:hypothetical protein